MYASLFVQFSRFVKSQSESNHIKSYKEFCEMNALTRVQRKSLIHVIRFYVRSEQELH